MKLLSKLLILLLLVPVATATANDKFKGRYTKEKTISKEYNVNADANLTVTNSYGNIDVVTWNENRVVIDVLIRTNGNNEEKVQKRLDDIDVDFSASASKVSAKTRFGEKGKSWSWWKKSKNNVSMEINYTIKLPVTNSVDLGNDYGSISLNRLEGKATINCDYGQVIIGDLMADGNSLNFDYTNNSTITYMKSGVISADYSGFNLQRVETLDLNADYTRSEIGEVSDLTYNCDYGKLDVGKVDQLTGRSRYLPNNIGTLTNRLKLNTDYGSIVVERMASSVKGVEINSDYTGVKLGYDSNLSFDFNVQLSYAGLNGKDDLNVTMSDKSNSSKQYQGHYNQANSGNSIKITSSYGGVTLKKL